MDANDLRRLELLVKALGRHRRESIEYSLAECLEDEHRAQADLEDLSVPVEAIGDAFVAQELAHACVVLAALSGSATCRAPECSDPAPAHWGWCLHHDLEQALEI